MLSHPSGSDRPLKVLVVEDSATIRRGVEQELAKIAGLELVGWADSAPRAIEEFARLAPDIVILDLALREGNGFDVLRDIRSRGSLCSVIVFSGHDTEQVLRKAEALGATRFISKTRNGGELPPLLRQLSNSSTAR